MEQIQQVTEVAKGISDYGMTIMMGAIYLILTALMMIAIFKWFKSLIDKIIAGQGETMNELLAETRKQNENLADISEGLRPETQLRIKTTANCYFDLATEQVCRLVRRVRTENHICDKEATRAKIAALLTNLHEDRNSKFDCYSYHGKKLSAYTSTEWIKEVAIVVEKEIYHPNGENLDRTYSNVKSAFDNIKIDFYHRLNN